MADKESRENGRYGTRTLCDRNTKEKEGTQDTERKIGSPKRPRILGMWRVNHNHGTKNNQEPNVRVQLMWVIT